MFHSKLQKLSEKYKHKINIFYKTTLKAEGKAHSKDTPTFNELVIKNTLDKI